MTFYSAEFNAAGTYTDFTVLITANNLATARERAEFLRDSLSTLTPNGPKFLLGDITELFVGKENS